MSWLTRVNRRASSRIPVDIKGRFFIDSEKREVDCEIINWSAEGVAVLCNSVPSQGTKVVLQVDGVCWVQGITVGPTKDATGIYFDVAVSERKQIAEKFRQYLVRDILDSAVNRRRPLPRVARGSGKREKKPLRPL